MVLGDSKTVEATENIEANIRKLRTENASKEFQFEVRQSIGLHACTSYD
jgi:hypothetical protein